jgi:hypothetical protein
MALLTFTAEEEEEKKRRLFDIWVSLRPPP